MRRRPTRNRRIRKGRMYVYIPIENRWMLRSRFVMEEHLGRPLRDEERIHHRDRNPLNDSLSNLVLFPSQSEHARLHALEGDTLNAEARERSAATRRKERTDCPVCGTPFLAKRLPSGKLQQTCSYRCSLVLFPTVLRFAGG